MSTLKSVVSMQAWEVDPGDMILHQGEPFTVVSIDDDEIVVINEWEEKLTLDIAYDQIVELLIWEDED